MTSMRRRYVASTSLRRHVPAGNLPPPLAPNILNLPTPMWCLWDYGYFTAHFSVSRISEMLSISTEQSSGVSNGEKNGWLVVLGITALSDSISVYIGPSHREREKEERNDR